MKGKQWAAGVLAALMLVGMIPASAAEAGLTRGEACEMLVTAADDYNPGVTAADILKGDANGNLNEDAVVTRVEALVMLERAFGDLPDPKGDRARWAYPAANFTDVPTWAQEELSDVFTAGIVAGTSATTFSPSTPVTGEQMDAFIRRVYALEGSNRKDDFYATVNKEWLDTAEIPTGYPMSGALYELTYEVNQQVADMIQTIVAGNPKAGSHEEKIKNLYDSITDWDARNKAGVEPLRPYLDAIDGATSLNELMEVRNRIADQEELAYSVLLSVGLTVDDKNSNQYILSVSSLAPSLPKETYVADSGIQKDAYLQYLTTLFTLGGDTAEQAAQDAADYYAMDKVLSAASLDQQDYSNVDKAYNLFTMDDLKAIFPNVDLDNVLSASGFKMTDKFLVTDVGLLKAGAAHFDDAHLDLLKISAKLELLAGLGSTLSKDFIDAGNAFEQAVYGIQGTLSDADLAAQIVQSTLSEYLGEAYVKQYFSAQAKANVEAMVEDFRAIYKSRIQNLEWMSETTKKKAVEKLDALAVNVGYPSDWSSSADYAEVKSPAQGGSYFSNILSIRKASRAEAVKSQGQPVNKDEWQMSAYTVNAYYDPTANSINFPAGILQAPFYDVDADKTENLGGIGYVIAHEMTHAFDNNGAKYDKYGNATDWWTKEDYAAFQKLCDQAVTFYDGVEAAPGITCNGALTLSENIADLGAIACITQAEAVESEPDYKTLYETAARTWRGTASREVRTLLAQTDVHAPDKLRGSRALQSTDEFYTAFGIQPGDGMWLAPEQRVRIW